MYKDEYSKTIFFSGSRLLPHSNMKEELSFKRSCGSRLQYCSGIFDPVMRPSTPTVVFSDVILWSGKKKKLTTQKK